MAAVVWNSMTNLRPALAGVRLTVPEPVTVPLLSTVPLGEMSRNV